MSKTNRSSFRLVSMFVVFMLLLVTLTARLVFVQGLDSRHFEALAADQRERRLVLAPQRGSIYDRNGSELAMSLDMQTIFANPHFISDPKAAANALAPILGQSAESIRTRLTRKAGFVYLARKVEPSVATAVKDLHIQGVDTVAESKRFYPAGGLASHVLGFVGTDNEGLGGMEMRFEKLLKGLPGALTMESDPTGRPIPAGHFSRTAPTAGSDIILTLDREIQYQTEVILAQAVQTYKAKAGSAIVMDSRNGDILALANVPTFDPNDVASSSGESRRNRALVDVYEPGSANKIITASAAIGSGVVKPDDMFKVPDNLRIGSKVFHDAHPHPVENLSFAQIIEQSSNIGTIKAAGLLGKERLYSALSRFGYGKPTGLDFPGESSGILPPTSSWSTPSMGTIPIGQGVAVTVMQIVNVYATVANHGVRVQPRLVRALVDENGKPRYTPEGARREVVKAATADAVTKILVRVTEGEHGTGKAAAVPGYQVAGKTGTAQKPIPGGGGYSGYVGSFIGFAPAGDPALVVGVVLDDPSPIWGGVTAAPTFKQIMQFALRHLGIGPGSVLQNEGTPLPTPVRSGGAPVPSPSTPSD